MDISEYGTIYSREVYTSKISHPAGNVDITTGNQITAQAPGGIQISAPVTTFCGDVSIQGKLAFTMFNADSLEGNALTVQGDSILQGAMDIKGPIELTEDFSVTNGNVQVDSNASLLNQQSNKFFMLGDGTIGSWRIGTSVDNKLTFQRRSESGWDCVGQIG